MSLLSYIELCELVEQGVIDAPMDNVNGSSIDLTLHHLIMVEDDPKFNQVVNLALKENIELREKDISQNGYLLKPGEFVLASSVEIFNLPADISAEYKLKSSMARNGLEHLNAGWCDPHWHGSRLTLEFKNMTQKHWLTLTAGMKCGQIVFFKNNPVPDKHGYKVRGQYNQQQAVTASKGLQ